MHISLFLVLLTNITCCMHVTGLDITWLTTRW